MNRKQRAIATIAVYVLIVPTSYLLGTISQERLDKIIQKYESDFSIQLERYTENFGQNILNQERLKDLPTANSKKLVDILKRTQLSQSQKDTILQASVRSIDTLLARKAMHAGAQAPTEIIVSLHQTLKHVENSNAPEAYKDAMKRRLHEIIDIISSHATAAAA